MPVKVLLGKQEYVLCQLEERAAVGAEKRIGAHFGKGTGDGALSFGSGERRRPGRSDSPSAARGRNRPDSGGYSRKSGKKEPGRLFLELFKRCAMEREEGRNVKKFKIFQGICEIFEKSGCNS